MRMNNRDQKLKQIKEWIASNEDIRAALLTSSLVNPLAPVDDYSDLDIELVIENLGRYTGDSSWISLFGSPMIHYEEGPEAFDGKHSMIMVQYMDGVKVDFKLYSISQFQQETQAEVLPEDWDTGYEILMDKDNLTNDIAPPTYGIRIIKRPSQDQFNKLVHDFYWDMSYLPKCLARGDIFYLKFMMEHIIRVEYFIPMLEWFIASKHNWEITTNKYGRLFPKYLSQQEWTDVLQTFAADSMEENYKAARKMLELFHGYAATVATDLDFTYESSKFERLRPYLNQAKQEYS